MAAHVTTSCSCCNNYAPANTKATAVAVSMVTTTCYHVATAHLGDVNELDDDLRALRGRRLAEHHTLDPLRQAVEESDGSLQARVVHQRALHRVLLEVAELKMQTKINETFIAI